jgi:hypothetical protein
MKHLNIKAFVGVGIILTILIWLLLLSLSGVQLQATWIAFKQLPTVLSIEVILWGLFAKWGWRYKIFQGWLVPFPYLQGTWRGKLSSTWINPNTQHQFEPIDVILVVRQTFINIHCTLMTEESESSSYSASIHIDPDSNERQLVYSYSNKPRTSIRDRSPIHDGTASLLVIGKPPRKLRGEYWTNRKTTGEISLEFTSRSFADCFS